MMKKKLLIFNFFLLTLNSYGQTEIVDPYTLSKITYNPITEKLEGTLPFDKDARFVIPKATNIRENGFIYETKLISVRKLLKKYTYYYLTDYCKECKIKCQDKKNESSTKDDFDKKCFKKCYKKLLDKKIVLPVGKRKKIKIKYTVLKKNKDSLLKNLWYNNPTILEKNEEKDSIKLYIEMDEITPVKVLKFQKDGKDNLTAYLPPLPPNKNHEIVLFKNYSSGFIQKIYELYYKRKKFLSFKDSIKNLPQYNEDLLRKLKGKKIPASSPLFTSIHKKYYGVDLKRDTTTIKNEIAEIVFLKAEQKDYIKNKIIAEDKKGTNRSKFPSTFPSVKEFYDSYLKESSSKYLLEKQLETELKLPLKDCTLTTSNIKHISTLFSIKEISYTSFFKLNKVFIDNNLEARKKFYYGATKYMFNYKKRLTALNTNLVQLQSLKTELENLYLITNDSIVNEFYNKKVDYFISILKKNIKYLKKKNDELITSLEESHPLTVLVATQSAASTLKKQNSNALIGDFGFVNAFANNYKGEWVFVARPHFGLNIHFGGIDKEQRIRDIKNIAFRHRFSLYIGVTIGAIDERGYRDFYSSLSPMIGINVRATRQIRFGLGTLFIREKNPNPIVDDSKIQIAPYASVSFDIDLMDYVKSLTKSIF